MSQEVVKDVIVETTEVPTMEEFNALKEKVERPPIVSVKERPWEIVVTEGFNDAAVKAAIDEAVNSRSGNVVQKTIVLGPGTYRLKNPLLTQTKDNAQQLEGLSVRGVGKRLTRVQVEMAPVAGSDPWSNNFITAHGLRYFSLEDMTVVSANENLNFAYLWSLATGPYNQEWDVRSVEFQGTWNRCFGFDGDATANLNSEFVMDRISTATNSRFKDAFFRTGGISQLTNQQNQFLNYWITNSQFVLTGGTVFRLDRGGSIRFDRGSWSATDKTNGPITFLSMPTADYNNRSATQVSVRGIRFEPKADVHKVIDCAWGNGSITFDDCCDLSSIQGREEAKEFALHRYVGQSPWGFGVMPTVRYRNCQFAGYHLYEGPKAERGNIVYDGCYFYRGGGGQKARGTAKLDPSTAELQASLRWTKGEPRYRFTDCENVDNVSNM